MAVERSRIGLLVGAAATTLWLAAPRMSGAAEPEITVYKNPT